MAKKKRKNKKSFFNRLVRALFCVAVACVLSVLAVSEGVKLSAKDRMVTVEEAAKLGDVDCVIVLGCQVRDDKSPSPMLSDRLERAVECYNAGVSPTLLMSGDHASVYYDEVGPMKEYAVERGVPSERVFKDHAGFSTYETMYRAKEVFGAKKVVIVTQQYHLYRALYIAKRLGMDAYGVSADLNLYAGQREREVREILARCKDAAQCITKPAPEALGAPVSLLGNGDETNEAPSLGA